MKIKKQIPFVFVLDLLEKASPEIKSMFGCYAIYVDSKIVLILRERKDSPRDNGIWLATTAEHHASLIKDFPSMRSIELFGPGPTGWQVLPVADPDFEELAEKACSFVLKRDLRIGKIPKPRKKKIIDKTRSPQSRKSRSS